MLPLNFWQTWLNLGARPKVVKNPKRGLYPPLSDPTKTHKVSHSHKLLCQCPEEQLPTGGITSAYRQKCSGTGKTQNISELFQQAFSSPKTKQQMETYLRPQQSKFISQDGEIQNGDTGNHQDILATRGVCLQHTQELVKTCQDLGWLVNLDKLEMEPKQIFDFVGYQFDLKAGRVRPTPNRWQNLQEKISDILSRPACPVRQFMSLIGLLTATTKQVHLGRLHMRPIQWHLKNNSYCPNPRFGLIGLCPPVTTTVGEGVTIWGLESLFLMIRFGLVNRSLLTN